MSHRARCHRLPPHRLRHRNESRPRSLVARARRKGRRDLRRRAARYRSTAVRALHLRHHRQAERHRAHHRRLSAAGHHDHEVGLRSARRRHLLVHGRHRLGHRPQLHRLRPALGRRDHRDVRRRARFPAARPLLAAHRKISRQHSLHLADRDPRVDPPGRPVAQRARSLEPAPAGFGRASRSIPRRGNGITRPSAKSAAPSSIPGGKPKPAPS